jgi:hypothetical protein
LFSGRNIKNSGSRPWPGWRPVSEYRRIYTDILHVVFSGSLKRISLLFRWSKRGWGRMKKRKYMQRLQNWIMYSSWTLQDRLGVIFLNNGMVQGVSGKNCQEWSW